MRKEQKKKKKKKPRIWWEFSKLAKSKKPISGNAIYN